MKKKTKSKTKQEHVTWSKRLVDEHIAQGERRLNTQASSSAWQTHESNTADSKHVATKSIAFTARNEPILFFACGEMSGKKKCLLVRRKSGTIVLACGGKKFGTKGRRCGKLHNSSRWCPTRISRKKCASAPPHALKCNPAVYIRMHQVYRYYAAVTRSEEVDLQKFSASDGHHSFTGVLLAWQIVLQIIHAAD